MTQVEPTAVRRLLPDLDGELIHAAGVLEELLLDLRACEDLDWPPLPATLEHGRALAALLRLRPALKDSERADGRGRLLAPDGRFELLPLHVVTVAPADVGTLSAAAQTLGAPRRSELLGEVLDNAAAIWSGPHTAADVVQLVARLAGLLDLEWTEDSELLAPRLLLLEVGQDVVLTDSELAAYERTADRLNQMWSGSAITRWLYSG